MEVSVKYWVEYCSTFKESHQSKTIKQVKEGCLSLLTIIVTKLPVVIDLLKVVKVSKAQSLQRSGRAGRESEGNCYRMLTRDEFERLSDETVPEIKRCNLTNVIMQVKYVSVSEI